MQVALIAASVTPMASVLVLIQLVVLVVVGACSWCSSLQLAQDLLQLPLVVIFLPATGANTPLALVQLTLCGDG